MSTIAVSGGTGGLGRAIVDGLNAAGKSTVVVLSREVSQLSFMRQATEYFSWMESYLFALSSQPKRKRKNLVRV